MRYERADGQAFEVSVEVEDILEAEKEPTFNFLKAVSGLADAKFSDWFYLASLVTVDGEKPGYKGLIARGFTLVDISKVMALVVADLGFTSDTQE